MKPMPGDQIAQLAALRATSGTITPEAIRQFDRLLHPFAKSLAALVPGGMAIDEILFRMIQTPGVLETALAALAKVGALPPGVEVPDDA